MHPKLISVHSVENIAITFFLECLSRSRKRHTCGFCKQHAYSTEQVAFAIDALGERPLIRKLRWGDHKVDTDQTRYDRIWSKGDKFVKKFSLLICNVRFHQQTVRCFHVLKIYTKIWVFILMQHHSMCEKA